MGAQSLTGSRSFVEATRNSSQWRMLKRRRRRRRRKRQPKSLPSRRPLPLPLPPSLRRRLRLDRRRSRKFQRSGSNVFSMFSQKQVAEFKEGFQLMDRDKDGILSKNDLRATFDELGRIAPEKELDEMINDAPGPINFTMLLTMFAERQSGGSDEDDVVIGAFRSFDDGEGHIDGESLRHALMTWGD